MRALALSLLLISQLSVAAEPLLDGYHKVSQALAYDRHGETRELAARLATTAKEWLEEKPASDPQTANVKKILSGAEALATAMEEKALRLTYGKLSEGVLPFVKHAGVEADWQLYYCPMAKGYRYWAQPLNEKMANPYMGLKMLQCGSKKAWAVLP